MHLYFLSKNFLSKNFLAFVFLLLIKFFDICTAKQDKNSKLENHILQCAIGYKITFTSNTYILGLSQPNDHRLIIPVPKCASIALYTCLQIL